MSSVAEEVEALRGARSATFKDLLTHRAFARLLAAMSVSTARMTSVFSSSLTAMRPQASGS